MACKGSEACGTTECKTNIEASWSVEHLHALNVCIWQLIHFCCLALLYRCTSGDLDILVGVPHHQGQQNRDRCSSLADSHLSAAVVGRELFRVSILSCKTLSHMLFYHVAEGHQLMSHPAYPTPPHFLYTFFHHDPANQGAFHTCLPIVN